MEKKWWLNKDLKGEREQACPYLGEIFPGKRNNRSKYPELGTCQPCGQSSKESAVAGAGEEGKA